MSIKDYTSLYIEFVPTYNSNKERVLVYYFVLVLPPKEKKKDNGSFMSPRAFNTRAL
jgi:hypothetical protein